MLKQRIITALVLVALVLLALIAPNPVYWRGLITLVVLAGFYEWLSFCKITASLERLICYALFGGALYISQKGYLPLGPVLAMVCVLWALLLVFTFTETLQFFHQKWLKLLVGIMILMVGAWAIIELKYLTYGPAWIIGFIGTVAAADIGAYFSGKRFGETKLAPKISPGKTVEGFLGGLVLVALIAVPVVFTLFSFKAATLILITVMLTSVVSVGGDLFESSLKRHVGLKDSGQLLPGHGGILDRIDGLLSGGVFFASGLFLLGYLN